MFQVTYTPPAPLSLIRSCPIYLGPKSIRVSWLSESILRRKFITFKTTTYYQLQVQVILKCLQSLCVFKKLINTIFMNSNWLDDNKIFKDL